MSNRSERALIAKQTVEILECGHYTSPAEQVVDLAKQIQNAVQGTAHLAPDSFGDIFRQRDQKLATERNNHQTQFTVSNTTTLAAARELLQQNASPVLCLNFASAKNPGGGFLSGSQAQEESLARASGLYASISGVNAYYDINRQCGTSLYTDHMIYSPGVPVFRDDADELIQHPYCISILTAPAVNCGAVIKNEPEKTQEIETTMLARIDKVLALAVVRGYPRLVLGAWGCGVFGNQPSDVAKWFATHLSGPVYQGVFNSVYFAVLDNTETESTIGPFQDLFSTDSSH